MESQAIYLVLKKILTEHYKVNSSLLFPANYNTHLTGSPFNLSAHSLTYLFFEVEETFHITIDDDLRLANGEFNTINGIKNIIEYASKK